MFELEKILGHMGPFALAIALALVTMAVAALGVFLERQWAYARSKRASKAFARAARPLLESGQTGEVLAAADEAKGSHLASLLASGLRTFLAQGRAPGGLSPVEAARRELLRRTEALAADVRRGLSVLASVGSVAPFVGLLGTVVGIIDAFQGIAKEGSGGLGAVSLGISEALVVTALGLLVAIPAVLAYNALASQSEALLRTLEQARGELVDYLEDRQGRASADVRA